MPADNEEVGEDVAEKSADDGAIENEPAVPETKELPEQIHAQGAGAYGLDDDRRKARAHNSADQQPDRQVLDELLANAFLLCPPARDPRANDEGQEQHGSKTVNGDTVR